MAEIKCPNCGDSFVIDESGYAKILQQVRNDEFERSLALFKAELERTQKAEYEQRREELIRKYEEKLDEKEKEVALYRDFKIRLSTKGVGESLEQFCECEFNKLRATAFPNAYFEKDNDDKDGSKGDYIYRESADGVEFISIMFEMKNEMETTKMKRTNESHFKKLDEDRRKKGCEYAVLVSLLEKENDLYNNGIVDVSYKYPKMYVIRPQFFIAMITILRNAALNSFAYKREIKKLQEQEVDVTRFEANLAEYTSNIENNHRLLRSSLKDAKEYGSILHMPKLNFAALYERIDIISRSFAEDMFQISYQNTAVEQLLPMVKQAEIMAQKYDVVVTNPPYMGGGGMSNKLADFVKKNYPDSKSDLFAVFIEKCGTMLKKNGYQAMITQHAWMFLSSYEKLRAKLLTRDTINMAHLGARAFEEIGGEVVQTTSFVFSNVHAKGYKGIYCRLIDPTTQAGKEEMFLSCENRYFAAQSNFSKIPGAPIAYWVGNSVFLAFSTLQPVSAIGEAKAGMTTGDNEKFLRLWPEVSFNKIGLFMDSSDAALKSKKKWFPYNKGGGFRKWYGLNEYVVLWENDGYQIKNATKQGRKIASVRSERLYFKKSITWATLTSSMISARWSKVGHLFDDKGSSAFIPPKYYCFVLALINSCVGDYFLHILNPTMSFQSGNIGALPIGRFDTHEYVQRFLLMRRRVGKIESINSQ